MKKKFAAVLLSVCLLVSFCTVTAFAATTTNGLDVTKEITTQNGDTAFVAKVGETQIYIEVKSGGATWPLDTANPFAATVCTVVDAAGNELGTLDSTEGTIDWSVYPDAAKIVCSTDFTGDVYDIVVADVAAMGADAPADVPSAPAETPDEAPADDTAPPADVPLPKLPLSAR